MKYECRAYPGWEKYLRRRLERGTSEASRFVLDEAEATWGGNVGEAVVDALEHFEDWQTGELRAILDLFESFCDWHEVWKPRGWRVSISGLRVTVTSPPGYEWGDKDAPTAGAIAAAAGVMGIKLDSVPNIPNEEERRAGTRTEIIFGVTED